MHYPADLNKIFLHTSVNEAPEMFANPEHLVLYVYLLSDVHKLR